MTKKEKSKLNKKWWIFCDEIEEKIEYVMYEGDGLLFILLLPVWFILKTIQWLMYLLGYWLIKMIPTSD